METQRTFGYIRVSTKDQHLNRQIDAMKEVGIPANHLYIDQQSGKDFNRPAYSRLVKSLRTGDLLVVKSIDRLGRNYDEIIEQWRMLTKERNVDIRVLDMPLLDTTHAKDLLGTFIADLTLQVLSYCAHAERDNTRQRQKEGIASAKARGVRFGRPKKELPYNIDELYLEWRQGKLTGDELASQCGMALGVLYRKLREQGFCVHDKVQFTRNYTQTAKRAADNKRRYAPGKGHSACLLWGYPKGAAPHLAHDFAKQSVVCYTLCRRCRENAVAAGEGKGI